MNVLCPSDKRPTRHNRGFVLLFVVLILALAAILLVRVSNMSFRQVRAVSSFEQDLKGHWTKTSVRRVFLGSDASWRRQIERTGESSLEISNAIQLNGLACKISIEDENAKLNLPAMAENLSPQAFAKAGSKCFLELGILAEEFPEAPQLLGWRGLTLDSRSPSDLVSRTRFTLWGTGKLNVRSASEDQIQLLWQAVFGRILPPEVLEYRKIRGMGWSRISASLGLSEKDSAKSSRWFTSRSETFSLQLTLRRNGWQSVFFYVDYPRSGQYAFEF